MPTYKNQKGQIVQTLTWDPKNNELPKISDSPMYNPMILSECYGMTSEIKIPEKESRFAIHFYAESGSPTVFYNSKDNQPPLKMYQGMKWNVRVFERIIDKLFIELGDDDRLWIEIERI